MNDAVMANFTHTELPALPSYTLTSKPSLIPGISDLVLQLLSPIVAYWVASMFFQALDSFDLFAQYRLHTPAEVLKRNHVTKYEVLKDVILQQIIQTITGYIFGSFDPAEMNGKDDYNIAVWAQRLRRAQIALPRLLAVLGVNSPKLAAQVYDRSPSLAAALAGGHYSHAGFASWEMTVASSIYWYLIPTIQFTAAILFVDTWQYFLHRAMHMNKYLYTTFHSRHHRLYVPYAFGALYNHPLEGFTLDTLGAGLAYMITGMSLRQGMCFYTCSTIKTVDDHCGYAFPWDPLQHFTDNNAAYHDVHHQSWGVKTNFSQPFFTFWDRVLGTNWQGGDVSLRYERDRISAQRKLDAETNEKTITNCPPVDTKKAKRQAVASQRSVVDDKENGGPQILADEIREEHETAQAVRRTPRRRTSGFDAKSLTEKVSGSLYGRSTPILHADGVH